VRVAAFAVVTVLALWLTGGCKTTTTTTTTTTEEVTGPTYTPPPPYVYDGLHQLGPLVLAGVRWGHQGVDELVQELSLERYHTEQASWGPPGAGVPVLEVQSARRLSITAFLLDPGDGTVRTVLIRDLPQAPPPQAPTASRTASCSWRGWE